MVLKELKVETWIGDKTNTYIVFDEKSKEAMVIDPAGRVDEIISILNAQEAKLKYIYLTHCHGDHIVGVNELKINCGGKILIHRMDSAGLNNREINLCPYMGMENIELEVDSIVDDLDTIHIGDIAFQVLHTPGHTQGGTSLYCKEQNLVFTGDTLFNGTWGRTDLPTGSRDDIIESIMKKLMILPDKTICYPGHGKATMIRDEKPIYLELKPKKY